MYLSVFTFAFTTEWKTACSRDAIVRFNVISLSALVIVMIYVSTWELRMKRVYFCHDKTSFCSLNNQYHMIMIKSNLTRGGKYEYLAMPNKQYGGN